MRKWIVVAFVASMMAVLAGCGSNPKEQVAPGGSQESVSTNQPANDVLPFQNISTAASTSSQMSEVAAPFDQPTAAPQASAAPMVEEQLKELLLPTLSVVKDDGFYLSGKYGDNSLFWLKVSETNSPMPENHPQYNYPLYSMIDSVSLVAVFPGERPRLLLEKREWETYGISDTTKLFIVDIDPSSGLLVKNETFASWTESIGTTEFKYRLIGEVVLVSRHETMRFYRKGAAREQRIFAVDLVSLNAKELEIGERQKDKNIDDVEIKDSQFCYDNTVAVQYDIKLPLAW